MTCNFKVSPNCLQSKSIGVGASCIESGGVPNHSQPEVNAVAEGASSLEEAAEARERRAVLLEEVQESISEAERYRADIAANESCRREIQAKIESAIDANSNVNFLKILSTFRIQVGSVG
jgi:hypothetical protein